MAHDHDNAVRAPVSELHVGLSAHRDAVVVPETLQRQSSALSLSEGQWEQLPRENPVDMQSRHSCKCLSVADSKLNHDHDGSTFGH